MSRPIYRDPLRLVAVAQLWAAASGSWVIIWAIVRADAIPLANGLILAIMLGVYSVVGWSGVLILRGSPHAIAVTKAALVPQLVQIANSAFAFSMIAGIGVVGSWYGGTLGINLAVTSTFNVSWLREGLPTGFAVNLFAWAILIWLVESRDEVDRRLAEFRAGREGDEPPNTRMNGTSATDD